MSKIYVINKRSNVYSSNSDEDRFLLIYYFNTLEDARSFLAKIADADEEFGKETFYKKISDNNEIERKRSAFYEGIYFTIDGEKKYVEYNIDILRSFNKKDL